MGSDESVSGAEGRLLEDVTVRSHIYFTYIISFNPYDSSIMLI